MQKNSGGSANLSMSQDKLHSNYDSVQEQTGIFAGKGGFDITVGEHAQLDGAVIASTIIIRDTDKQQQNVDDLSRDTDNANGSIGPIFDKEKEQNCLKEAQLIGEIGGQAMDI
ncbi:putative adhesin [Yersinia kristensenii]|nr:hypothetical protein [Yersinia kristensenii]CNH42730.1 putative adhesin [Yersinia kristensenii]CNJ96156.1 putative adhesin [Yersinia kristensenii]